MSEQERTEQKAYAEQPAVLTEERLSNTVEGLERIEDIYEAVLDVLIGADNVEIETDQQDVRIAVKEEIAEELGVDDIKRFRGKAMAIDMAKRAVDREGVRRAVSRVAEYIDERSLNLVEDLGKKFDDAKSLRQASHLRSLLDPMDTTVEGSVEGQAKPVRVKLNTLVGGSEQVRRLIVSRWTEYVRQVDLTIDQVEGVSAERIADAFYRIVEGKSFIGDRAFDTEVSQEQAEAMMDLAVPVCIVEGEEDADLATRNEIKLTQARYIVGTLELDDFSQRVIDAQNPEELLGVVIDLGRRVVEGRTQRMEQCIIEYKGDDPAGFLRENKYRLVETQKGSMRQACLVDIVSGGDLAFKRNYWQQLEAAEFDLLVKNLEVERLYALLEGQLASYLDVVDLGRQHGVIDEGEVNDRNSQIEDLVLERTATLLSDVYREQVGRSFVQQIQNALDIGRKFVETGIQSDEFSSELRQVIDTAVRSGLESLDLTQWDDRMDFGRMRTILLEDDLFSENEVEALVNTKVEKTIFGLLSGGADDLLGSLAKAGEITRLMKEREIYGGTAEFCTRNAELIAESVGGELSKASDNEDLGIYLESLDAAVEKGIEQGVLVRENMMRIQEMVQLALISEMKSRVAKAGKLGDLLELDKVLGEKGSRLAIIGEDIGTIRREMAQFLPRRIWQLAQPSGGSTVEPDRLAKMAVRKMPNLMPGGANL